MATIQIAPSTEDITIQRTAFGEKVSTQFNGSCITFTAPNGMYTHTFLKMLMRNSIGLSTDPSDLLHILTSTTFRLTNINVTAL